MSKFILRFDDVTATMNWDRFYQFYEAMAKEKLIGIIGVVPKNEDKKLIYGNSIEVYWDVLRKLQHEGWSIAQHGYNHKYVTNDSGILGINNRSEYAGLPYDVQHSKIRNGKALLVDNGIWNPIFMPPAHSFDQNTISALIRLGFKYITDGYGFYPYKASDMTFVPCLFSRPFHLGFGVYTINVHVNTISSEGTDALLHFIRFNSKNIIPFKDAISIKPHSLLLSSVARNLSEYGLKTFRTINNSKLCIT
jgi:predicted deacetylase